jgi:hypothetical protein
MTRSEVKRSRRSSSNCQRSRRSSNCQRSRRSSNCQRKEGAPVIRVNGIRVSLDEYAAGPAAGWRSEAYLIDTGKRSGPRKVVPGRISKGPVARRSGNRWANARRAIASSIRANAEPRQ